MDFSSSPKRQRLGVYFLCNDVKIDWAYAMLASFREYNPVLPLTLIPYNNKITKLGALRDKYSFDIFEHECLQQLEALTIPAFGKPNGLMRKYAPFFAGHYDYFFYLDSDIIVTSDLHPLIEASIKSEADLVYVDTDLNQVYLPGSFRDEMVARYNSKGFNAGVWFSRYGLFDFEWMKEKAGETRSIKDNFVWLWDQPIINYFCDVAKIKTRLFSDVIPEYFRESWYRQVHPKRVNGQWVESSASGATGKPICLIHYAGQSSPVKGMHLYDIYFAYLEKAIGSKRAQIWEAKTLLIAFMRPIWRKSKQVLKAVITSVSSTKSRVTNQGGEI